ncbi:radical SAM protein [Candidatus Falkowbacteria bacterium]|nr:radical SAM protein [Candidatus Falkowbacteria bacterium]
MNTKAPIIQQHELTSKCNNNCRFCYNPERCWQSIAAPRNEDSERNLEVARISIAKGVMAACPTGGEPLLAGDNLINVLKIYRQAGCYTSINTNGRLITRERAERLSDHGLNSALISLHGVGKLHDSMVGEAGAFTETLAGMANLADSGVRVMPNFVATAQNLHGLDAVARLLLDRGFSAMTVTPFLPSWAAPEHEQFILQAEHYRRYFQVVKKIASIGMKIDSTLPIPPCVLIKFFPNDWQSHLIALSPRVCMAGKSFGVVSPDGRFRACIQAPYLDDYGGDVMKNYDDSWSKANGWAEHKLLPQECLDCAALPVCGGGCRTSCLWENQGLPEGKTMYMGRPLSDDEAQPFIERMIVETISEVAPYEWNARIMSRQESWGTIVFNPGNQSFCLLSPILAGYMMAPSLDFQDQHTTQVLLAVGAIKRSSAHNTETVMAPAEANVLSANSILPRLAGNLQNSLQARQLRADTGERLFF